MPPEPRPEPPWWDNPWPALLAGVLGLIAGGLVGFAVGDKGKTVTQAQRNGEPAITRTTTVVQPKVLVRTSTVTTQAGAPPNSANERRRTEAEQNLRTVERENEELKRRLGEG